MIKRVARFAVIVLLLQAAQAFAGDIRLELKGLANGLRQGEAALISVTSSVRLTSLSCDYEGRALPFKTADGINFSSLLGIDMNKAPDDYSLLFKAGSAGRDVVKRVSFTVLPRKYSVERLSLPEKMVKPDAVTLKKIKRDGRSLRSIWGKTEKNRFWNGDFLLPVDGEVTNNFGARRILNGVAKNPHTGVDVKAYQGKRIVSPNAGRVALVDNLYYGGKTVVLDHGQGLYTSYMHLSKILVNYDEEVAKGELIGLVGATGRATGPHLHWSARLNGARVDPVSLLGLFKEGLSESDYKIAKTKGADKLNLAD